MNDPLNFFKNHLAQTTENSLALNIKHAKGSYLFGDNGQEYLDLTAGISVSALGHGHPRINSRLKKQIDQHLHLMVYGEVIQEAQNDLAKELLKTLPQSLNSFYFLNSGTEANEAALKLVKRATKRKKIISFIGAYHGSTHGSLSVSYGEHRKKAFQPLLTDIEFIRLNNTSDLKQIDEDTAGVILETIQGDAGVRKATNDYLKALRERCDEVGALLILDEIQCGMGRSGKMWAFQHGEIVSDILTMGKALGAGLPIGAMAASKELMSSLSHSPSLGHITTFGGHPLICAGAAEGLKIMQDEDILEQVEQKGQLFKKLLDHPDIVEVRQIGLMLAVELKSPELVEKLVLEGIRKGIILFWFLSTPNAFRISPPLNIEVNDIEKACRIITEILNDLS